MHNLRNDIKVGAAWFDLDVAPGDNYGLLSLMDFLKLLNHNSAVNGLALGVDKVRNPRTEFFDPEEYGELYVSGDLLEQVVAALKLLSDDASLLEIDSTLITLTIDDYEKRIVSGESVSLSRVRERLEAIEVQYNSQCERKRIFRLTMAESEMFDNQSLFGGAVCGAFSSPATCAN